MRLGVAIVGLARLALTLVMLSRLTFTVWMLALELATASGPSAASWLVRFFFGVLAVLGRIFHVCVLVVALRWSLFMWLTLSLCQLFILLIAFVVTVATRSTATALSTDIDLSLRLAFGWLRLKVCLSFVALAIRPLLKVVTIASLALAASLPFVVVLTVALALLFAIGAPTAEILIIAGSVVVIAHLGLIGHRPHRSLLLALLGGLGFILDLFDGAREGWLFGLELDACLTLSLVLIDFLARGLGLVVLGWTIVAVFAITLKVVVGLAFVSWLLGTMFSGLDLVILPELQLFVLFLLTLLLLLLFAR